MRGHVVNPLPICRGAPRVVTRAVNCERLGVRPVNSAPGRMSAPGWGSAPGYGSAPGWGSARLSLQDGRTTAQEGRDDPAREFHAGVGGVTALGHQARRVQPGTRRRVVQGEVGGRTRLDRAAGPGEPGDG